MSNITKKLIEAYLEISEKKKLDPVDAKALKGKHDDREDGDIDNDGDEDESDEYLHNRRKAISKSLNKESVELEEKSKVQVIGGTSAKGGVIFMGAKGIDKMIALSKENPTIEYTVKSDNYGDFKAHWLKNGKFAKQTVANANFDFSKNAVRGKPSGKLVKDTIFSLSNVVNEYAESVELDEAKDMSEMCCKGCGDKFGQPKSESCMYDAYNAEGKNWIKMKNEEVELDEMTSAQKAKFDKLYKKMLNGPEHKKIMSKADNKIKGDDQFHALVKKMAMEEVSEAMTISRKMAQRALANAKAQPKDKVSLKKAPWDKDKKSTNEEEVVMNPKQKKNEKGSDTMANEEVELPTIYSRILEARKRPEGEKAGETAAKGEMDFVKNHTDNIKVNDDDEKGHDDASKAGRASPNAKARSGDNMKGDKKVIPSATKMKG